jgi:hypothetical protein
MRFRVVNGEVILGAEPETEGAETMSDMSAFRATLERWAARQEREESLDYAPLPPSLFDPPPPPAPLQAAEPVKIDERSYASIEPMSWDPEPLPSSQQRLGGAAERQAAEGPRVSLDFAEIEPMSWDHRR